MAKPKITFEMKNGEVVAKCPHAKCRETRKGRNREKAGNAIAAHVLAAHGDSDYLTGNA